MHQQDTTPASVDNRSTKSKPHLHQLIGNAIGTRKRELYRQLRSGHDLGLATAEFLDELSLALDEIYRAINLVTFSRKDS